MNLWNRLAQMENTQALYHQGWHFLCRGEPLSSGHYHAVVHYHVPPGDEVRTLVLDFAKFDTGAQALEHAKALATQWAQGRGPAPR